jgi:hypothetical protein
VDPTDRLERASLIADGRTTLGYPFSIGSEIGKKEQVLQVYAPKLVLGLDDYSICWCEMKRMR